MIEPRARAARQEVVPDAAVPLSASGKLSFVWHKPGGAI